MLTHGRSAVYRLALRATNRLIPGWWSAGFASAALLPTLSTKIGRGGRPPLAHPEADR